MLHLRARKRKSSMSSSPQNARLANFHGGGGKKGTGFVGPNREGRKRGGLQSRWPPFSTSRRLEEPFGPWEGGEGIFFLAFESEGGRKRGEREQRHFPVVFVCRLGDRGLRGKGKGGGKKERKNISSFWGEE